MFEHRGFMLDVSRHYMPPEEIKKLLDAARILGLNRMHWHLTDDQGWRIEIRKYPELTEKGSVRGWSCFGGTPIWERNSGFYTQEEIRDLVAYAAERGIEIIPEIEIPGHAAAMLAACPQLACRKDNTGRRWKDRVEISGGIFPSLVCAGNPETLPFQKDVLDEVTELFPFPMVHIGGDEAVKVRWRRCPDCQKRIREENLSSEDALQRRLVLQIGEYLSGKGRKTIVWNDVLAGGLPPPYFIVQQWMGGEAATRAFMDGGGSVIRSDNTYFYMDYPYGEIDVGRIREMPVIPDYAKGLEDRLLGFECPLWTERVTSLERAAWLLFPRLTAVSCRLSGEKLSGRAFMEKVAATEKKREEATGLKGAPADEWELSPADAEREREAEQVKIRSGKAGYYVRRSEALTRQEAAERNREKP